MNPTFGRGQIEGVWLRACACFHPLVGSDVKDVYGRVRVCHDGRRKALGESVSNEGETQQVGGTCPLTLFNDAGAAFHLLVVRVSGRWVSEPEPGVLGSDPVGKKLAFGRPMAQNSLLLHTSTLKHTHTHLPNDTHTHTWSDPAPHVTLILVYERKCKYLSMLS